jgi:hypothetical protein
MPSPRFGISGTTGPSSLDYAPCPGAATLHAVKRDSSNHRSVRFETIASPTPPPEASSGDTGSVDHGSPSLSLRDPEAKRRLPGAHSAQAHKIGT